IRHMLLRYSFVINPAMTTYFYTFSLHDALPISYEVLRGRVEGSEQPAQDAPKTPRIPGATKPAASDNGGGIGTMINEALFGRTGTRGGQYDGLVQTMAKTAARSVASGIGRQIVRGVLGSLLGGKRR